MMQQIKEWFIQADAHKVCTAMYTGLALVTGVWVWFAFAPLENEMASTPPQSKDRAPLKLGIAEYLDEVSGKTERATRNPFRTASHAQPDPPEENTQQNTWQKTRPPKAEPLQLTYRGMIERTDGKVLALIENSRTKRSVFYSEGQDISGLKVGGISGDAVEIIRLNGTTQLVSEAKAFTFREVK